MRRAARHPPLRRLYGPPRARARPAHHRKLDGRTEGIWLDGRPKPDGPEVLKRLRTLPGFGEQKAKIFLALLGKQRGVTPKGRRETAGAYGDRGSRRSIADVISAETLAEVRAFKKAAKAAAG
ncbi:uncharacterized HhH-GPD family protein [Amycolatopsis pretoriensis]|uniref:Uncharacterized HhH-GPD family protein n=1 Tax=Amycolatopsis pretoriensis TaxID=218821 RepID=A0A1H5QND8_9PSEU|nr:uncharacterized HhH-GPD family protein [Amycolatopsis pretoriensis]